VQFREHRLFVVDGENGHVGSSPFPDSRSAGKSPATVANLRCLIVLLLPLYRKNVHHRDRPGDSAARFPAFPTGIYAAPAPDGSSLYFFPPPWHNKQTAEGARFSLL